MEKRTSEDLRVRKTKEAIRTAFQGMICEMDYDQITVKELTARAQINRKTFYLHYNSLDDLLAELQEEIAAQFLQREVSYGNMEEIQDLIRLFFQQAADNNQFFLRFKGDAAGLLAVTHRGIDNINHSHAIFSL